ncbi:conserved hypothetical protein, partial [Ricinus communis]
DRHARARLEARQQAAQQRVVVRADGLQARAPVHMGDGRYARHHAWPDRRGELHERRGAGQVEIRVRPFGEHDGSQRAEPFALLDARIDPVADFSLARIGQDAAVAQGARPEFAAALVQREYAAPAQQVEHVAAQDVGIGQVGDVQVGVEVIVVGEGGFDVVVTRDGAQVVVGPAVGAAGAGQFGEAVQRATQRGARIARRGRDEDLFERRFPQQALVGRTVQRSAAGEAQ